MLIFSYAATDLDLDPDPDLDTDPDLDPDPRWDKMKLQKFSQTQYYIKLYTYDFLYIKI